MSASSPGSVFRFALAALLAGGVSAPAPTAPPDLLAADPVLPDGLNAVSLAVTPAAATAGFIVPGSKIDVLATRRVGDKVESFQLLSDVLVIAVDVEPIAGKAAEKFTISLAATEKQALAIALAKDRGYRFEVALRNPDQKDAGKRDSIDAVIKKLRAPEVAPAPRLVGRR